mgnify:CR=1 FL=1|tara:strand:+ start:1957 stop:2238 length:282 start_codon:yes stop_codon:yes gene_type:complete
MKVKIICIVIFFSFFFSCNKESIIIDEGDGITIEFLEGFNDDPQFQLSEKGTYKDGIEVGQSEYYDENGKIREPYETILREVFDKSMEEGGKD